MGNRKQKWLPGEEEALLAGVAKHGPGKWKNIIRDPEFAPSLTHRTNVDLKDKWRNLSPSYSGQSSKENPSPKIKSIVPASPVNIQSSAPAASIRGNAASDADMDDPSNSILDGKNASRYNTMIFEAISTMKDANGSDIGAILNYIKQRHEMPVPRNFRRFMSTRLRRLVLQGKLEKVQDGYKIRKETPSGTKIPTPKPKDIGPRPLQNSVLIAKNLKDVSDTAAYKVADAENKSFLAAEAIKEAERILKITEDTETILQLMKDIHEQCIKKNICTHFKCLPTVSSLS